MLGIGPRALHMRLYPEPHLASRQWIGTAPFSLGKDPFESACPRACPLLLYYR